MLIRSAPFLRPTVLVGPQSNPDTDNVHSDTLAVSAQAPLPAPDWQFSEFCQPPRYSGLARKTLGITRHVISVRRLFQTTQRNHVGREQRVAHLDYVGLKKVAR